MQLGSNENEWRVSRWSTQDWKVRSHYPHPDWEAEERKYVNQTPVSPETVEGRVAVRMNGHSCHHRKQNEVEETCPASSPANHLLHLSVGQLCSEGSQCKTAQECGGHGPHTEHRGRKAGGKGSISRTVDLWVTKGLALLMSKELNYYNNPLQYSRLEYSKQGHRCWASCDLMRPQGVEHDWSN